MRRPSGRPLIGNPCHRSGCENLSHKVPSKTKTTSFSKYVLSLSYVFSVTARRMVAERLTFLFFATISPMIISERLEKPLMLRDNTGK